MMIKAGILTPNFSTGGAERWVATLLKYADPNIIRWTGVCISGWGSLDPLMCEDARIAGVPLFSEPKIERTIPKGRPTPAAKSPDCERYVKRFPSLTEAVGEACGDADLLLAWGDTRYVDYLNQPNVAKTFVYCSHSSHHRPVKIAPPPLGVSMHLTAVSEMAKRPITRPGNPPITVIYNGVDRERLYPTQSRRSIRDSWGVNDNDKVIVYVGRFSPEKNPHAAINALRGLPPGWVAVHYGDHLAHGDLLAEAKERVRAENLPAKFYEPISDVGNVFAGGDVVMLASNAEAFSLVMIEAWLCRKPVISTPVGAVPELEARFGKMVIGVESNPRSDDLAAACEFALSAEGDAIVARAYQVAMEHFTAEAMMARWQNYLMSVMEAKR